jgi:integrase
VPRNKTVQTNIPGFGFIYQPTYRSKKTGELKRSLVWWMQYAATDKPVRQSTGRKDQAEAFNELLKIAGKRASAQILNSAPERVTIGELLDLLEASYELKRTLVDLKVRTAKLRERFGAMRAIDLRKSDLMALVESLRALGRQPATTNRYLANLHRAFQLGADEDPPLVLRIPSFPWQDESDNVRQGILDRDIYVALRDNLAPHARLVLVIGYYVGMRRGEILGLRWDQIDFEAGLIRLERKQTKNKLARVVPIYGEMRAHLDMALAERDAKYPDCPWVVQFNGSRVYDLKTAWKAGLKRANISVHLLVHDLRRTALSNMEEAGIPRHRAMQYSGHKTESVYRRYLVGSSKAVAKDAATMERFHARTLTGLLPDSLNTHPNRHE